MGQDDIAQQDHQVGVLVIGTFDPYIDAILEIKPLMGTAQDPYIIIPGLYQLNILHYPFKVPGISLVKFKEGHIVFHARDPRQLYDLGNGRGV